MKKRKITKLCYEVTCKTTDSIFYKMFALFIVMLGIFPNMYLDDTTAATQQKRI